MNAGTSVLGTAVALTATLALAAASWFVVSRPTNGMDMGAAPFGSLESFIARWLPMMAAMMLPGAVPAIVRLARADGHARSVLLFVGSYLFTWSLVGVAVYALYRPHGSFAAGVVAIVTGVYEFTPLKAHFRRLCRTDVRSGFAFGRYCIGSSFALMLMQAAFGAMSVTWMLVITLLTLAQKLLPAKAAIDVPLALAIIGFGILIVAAPSLVPGLMPPICTVAAGVENLLAL